MRKLLFLLAVIISLNLSAQSYGAVVVVPKMDTVKCDTPKIAPVIILGILEAIEDTTIRNEAIAVYQNGLTAWYAMPVKNSPVSAWVYWVFFFLFLPVSGLLTLIFRLIPTSYKTKYKDFRWLEIILELGLKIIKLIPNKAKGGGKHD